MTRTISRLQPVDDRHRKPDGPRDAEPDIILRARGHDPRSAKPTTFLEPTLTYPPIPQAPQPSTKKLSTGAIVAIVIGAVVVLICGICSVGALINAAIDKDQPATDTNSTATLAATTAPAATTQAQPPATPANLEQTSAPKPATAVIPKGLVGTNALIAREQLEALGFTNIHYASADENDTFVILAQNWTVTKVEPTAGTVLALDATIVLTCTKKK